MIRPARVEDASAIAMIYNYYIENTWVTFEVDSISEADMASRIEECQEIHLPWLVAVNDGKVIGYCYASKWKGRCAYRHSVEATIYLDSAATAKGWGIKLYTSLLSELKHRDVHAVICGIALPNAASIALHEKLGMEKVAHFKEVGNKFGEWVDVGYWQCLLND